MLLLQRGEVGQVGCAEVLDRCTASDTDAPGTSAATWRSWSTRAVGMAVGPDRQPGVIEPAAEASADDLLKLVAPRVPLPALPEVDRLAAAVLTDPAIPSVVRNCGGP